MMPTPEDPPLFVVTDTFSIEGRGIILAPGIPREGAPAVRPGDPVTLRTPSGEIIRTSVQALEMIGLRLDGKPVRATPILLPVEIRKSDIPIGTEVFLGKATGNS